MRVLQINPNGSEASALDLHPTISVVTGLGDGGRALIRRAFEEMSKGRDPGCGGLLEAHGVLFDLSAEAISMLDLTARVGVVITPEDIASVGESLRRGAGPPTFDRAQIDQFIAEAPVGEFPDLDLARNARNNSREALEILREAAAKSQAKYDDKETSLRRAEAELDVARTTGPRVRLVTEDDADANAEDTEVVSLDDLRARHDELVELIDVLHTRGAQIERGLKELSSIDVRPLTVLLDAIRSPSPVELVPSERAQELADDVKILEARVADLERELDDSGMGTAGVMQRLEQCRAEVAQAERSMKKPELGPADVEELEAAHEQVFEAEQKASSGLFKGGARKALEEALEAQQRVLDRVGFPTWTAYVMGASLLSIDPIAEQRLEKARLDLEGAEAHWARITETIESNPEHRTLLNKLEEVYLEAYDLLGGEEPDDLEYALRNLQVAKREVTTEELADALAYQLELLGLPLGESPSVDLVVMAADAFVEEAAAITGRIAELRAERAHREAELADATMRLNELPVLPPLEPEAQVPSGIDLVGFDPFESLGADETTSDTPDDSFGSFANFGDDGAGGGADDGNEGTGGSRDDSGFGGFVSFDSFPSLVPDDDEDGADGNGGGASDTADGGADDGQSWASLGPAEPGAADVDDGFGGEAFGGEVPPSSADFDEHLRAAEAAVADAAVAAETQASADRLADTLAGLEQALELAIEEEAEYREWVESRDALVDTALQIETVAATKLSKIAVEILTSNASWIPGAADVVDDDGIPEVADVIAFLHERFGSLRQVSFAGSVPVVLDDALRAMPTPDIRQVLSEIEADAASVQVLYLSDDPDLVGWADEVGFQRAAVVDAPPAFA